jgi:hypothetical protein
MKKTIQIEAFIDENENPTCCLDIDDNLQFCVFYNFGRGIYNDEVCTYDGTALKRRSQGAGHLIPSETCPLWSKG